MNPIQIKDFYSYRFLSDVKLSPNGERGVFLVHQMKEKGDGYQSDLWLADCGKEPRKLTSSGDAGNVLWLDDGALLFSSSRGGKHPGVTDFYILSPDGGEAEKAFRVPAEVGGIEAIGNGQYVILAKYDSNAPDVTGLDEEARDKKLKEYYEDPDCDVFDELPFWFNGKGIVNKIRDRLYLFTQSTGELSPLTPPMYQTEGWALDASAGRILCWGQEYRDISKMQQDLRLYTMDGTEQVLIPNGRFSIAQADFYQEKFLMLATEGKKYGINENPVFYTVDPSGDTSLLCGEDLSYFGSVGSDCHYGGGAQFQMVDGCAYFVVTDRVCTRLARLSASGEIQYLTKPEGTVDCFHIQNGRCLMIGAQGMELQELYEYNLESGSKEKISSLNLSALADKTVKEPVPLPFSGRDGYELDGWVIEPVGYEPGKTYPAILDIHGGPKTAYGPVFFHEMQVWASAGYFVMFCNPRGGDGRGNAFADIRGQYGGIDFDDLMDFVDCALKKYADIDPKRLGVTGGSYGGFMTNWIIGHTNRFAAAASQRSIASWISMEGVSDIGFDFPKDQVAASTWDQFDKLWSQSPLRYADQCSTPTLFIHSKEDYRCPENEGIQMFSALKRFGVPARLCLFHHESHELSRSGLPRRRVRRLEEITQWFDQYLKK